MVNVQLLSINHHLRVTERPVFGNLQNGTTGSDPDLSLFTFASVC